MPRWLEQRLYDVEVLALSALTLAVIVPAAVYERIRVKLARTRQDV